jgi:hypothetical protein
VDNLTSNTEGGISKDITGVTAYPNPTSTNLTLNFETLGAQKLTLRICDTTGKVIQTVFKKKKFDNGKNSEIVDLTSISTGAYLYVLQNRRGKTVASGQFVVVK